MLDDLKMIHERDAQDALGVAAKQWQQLRQEYSVQIVVTQDIQNVVLAGMGGSALFGAFIQTWPGVSVPFETVRNYTLPRYVNGSTLVIVSSYSGNTEETLSALEDAKAKGAQIVVVAAGGKLAELAKAGGLPLFEIPGGIQPRMSSFYFIAALVQLFVQLGLTDASAKDELVTISDWLQSQPENWLPEVPTANNQAKQIAQEMIGRSAVVYGGPLMAAAAQKWKICFNENAKNVAWWNQYPEFNHNEFMGWTSHPTDKPYAVVDIRSNLEHERVQKRFVVTERLLSGKRPAPIVVEPQGDTVPKQLFYSSMLGDFVSIYVALLNGINPTPVDLIEKFKAALNE